MASDLCFVEFMVEQMGHPNALSFKKMFGEYALYYHNKIIALVCDNQLFLKPTEAVRHTMDRVDEAPPYPGAQPYFRITEYIDDRKKLQELVFLTANALPDQMSKTKSRQ